MGDVRTCKHCKKTKDLDTGFYGDRHSYRGKAYKCKECHKVYVKLQYAKGKRRSSDRFRYYAITKDVLLDLLKQQDYKCPICFIEITEENCHVDHDHDFDSIRGLLCAPCNKGLGFFKDNIQALENAANYIRKSLGLL